MSGRAGGGGTDAERRAEARPPDGRGASPPKGEDLSHVNRVFVTDTSSNAWTVVPTLTRPFSSRM